MNYTTKYHLPQWDETDRIMRTDFNQMCRDMEAGIDSAHAAAAELPYVVGSYVGNGEITREINLGFRPRFAIICGNQRPLGIYGIGTGVMIAGPTDINARLTLTDTGLHLDISEANGPYPYVNQEGALYDYIAFR